ncbi:CPBP family intramembrane metalloprotease [Balneolaceae bacterium ANBcel3]|nr:CPBP family intramembrane metalloprotease [Balneolaceae bacterium ANBcel3]
MAEFSFDKKKRPALLALSGLSLVLYVLVAALLFYFFHDDPIKSLRGGFSSPTVQIIAGLLSGCGFAFFIWLAIFISPVSSILSDYSIVRTVAQLKLTRFDQMQLSFFAGLGEEVLFRAAIQPLLGIWLTSVLFVGIHGYFKWTSWKHLVFGLMMFLLSIGLGFLYQYTGLIAAISAHVIYDVLIFRMGDAYFKEIEP